MHPSSARRVNLTWIIASGLTLLAWALAASRSGGRVASSAPEAVAALAVGAAKARLVVQEFMEVRSAPTWLRRGTDAWLVGLCVTVLALYLS
jgi:hypothetical protein